MAFKILFPAGYSVDDINNNNIDVHVILKNGDVYFATVFTVANVERLMQKDGKSYFWAADMVIVETLDLPSLKRAIKQMIDADHLEVAFDKIGNVKDLYPHSPSFEQIRSL
jgi:hypothetical protein